MNGETPPVTDQTGSCAPEAQAAPAGQTLVLGIGTGRCGTHALAALLNQQPGACVTHEARPLLAWRAVPGRPGIRERLARFRRNRTQPLIGDVALFYLPHVEEALTAEPGLRVLCLERPREEVVTSFCRWLDAVHPLPTNHWTDRPRDGWHHHPVWTRAFPQYPTNDRAQGIRLYWEEYHQRAAELARRFPDNVRVFPLAALNTAAGVRGLLSFAGVPEHRQVVATGLREASAVRSALHPRQAALAGASPHDPRRCAVLVPRATNLAPACAAALAELEHRGHTVQRGSDGPRDLRQSQMATDALLQGFEETLWVDPDLGFDPDDVARLRRHAVPIVCGLEPSGEPETKPFAFAFASAFPFPFPFHPAPPGGEPDPEEGLIEREEGCGGFVLVRHQVYTDIQSRLDLPVCNEQRGRPWIPFFHPDLRPWNEGWECSSGEHAFFAAARLCGYRVLVDTGVRQS